MIHLDHLSTRKCFQTKNKIINNCNNNSHYNKGLINKNLTVVRVNIMQTKDINKKT